MMKCHPGILAGTALGLLMVTAPLGAYPLQDGSAYGVTQSAPPLPLILAQANCAEGESAEACAAEQPATAEEAAPAEPEQKPHKKKQEKQAEPAPTEQAAPTAEPEQKAAPAEQAVPAEPEQKPHKKKQKKQAEPAPAEQPAPVAEPEQKAAPAEQAVPTEPEQKPRKKKHEKQAGPAPAEQAAPSEETAPTPEAKPAPTGEKAPVEAPVEATPEKAPTPATAPEAPVKSEKQKVKKPVAEQPSPSEETMPESKQPVQGEAPAEPDAAPILDSQKDANRPRNGEKRDRNNREKPANQNGEQAATPPAVDQGPPPADDKAAQQEIRPEKIEPVTEEKGKRRDKAPDMRQRERREGVDVLKEIGDRIIIELGGRTMVESTDRSRMTHDARDVYYEDLPRGRTRETIERRNGDRVVTIRNRNGDIVQRSRITQDGREYVLNYVDERHYDNRGAWRDPGDDLPPMRLTIPRNQYILDSESVQSPDDFYEFLEQPPVERVQRLYSLQEVKRSARVRDIARRIDLDTLTFEFGSASIADSEVEKLEGVANAMERLLEKNPAETFLIEGHTDAVGSEDANLALSDRRAEAVAEALTNVFGIPPENLTTQGYGEQYLKVNVQGPERENRRVAIRRITSLVAPVASTR